MIYINLISVGIHWPYNPQFSVTVGNIPAPEDVNWMFIKTVFLLPEKWVHWWKQSRTICTGWESCFSPIQYFSSQDREFVSVWKLYEESIPLVLTLRQQIFLLCWSCPLIEITGLWICTVSIKIYAGFFS